MSIKSANMTNINTYDLYAEDQDYVSMECERYFVRCVMGDHIFSLDGYTFGIHIPGILIYL
jgi:hypothetical protein